MADVAQIVQSLLPTVINVLGGVMKSGDAGLFGKLREAGALAGFLSSSADQFKGNGIMEGLLNAIQGQEGLDMLKNLDLANLDPGDVLKGAGGLDDALKDAGDDGAPVKQFVYDLANQVASAAGGGLFGTGAKISSDEQQFLDDLKDKLGL
jgi:hypothetical protein